MRLAAECARFSTRKHRARARWQWRRRLVRVIPPACAWRLSGGRLYFRRAIAARISFIAFA